MSSIKLNDLLKIGSDVLQTTAQTLSGAVNELKAAITTLSSAITTIGTDPQLIHGDSVGGASAYWYYLFNNPLKAIPNTYYLEKSVTLSTSDVTVVTFIGLSGISDPEFDVSISEWISPESGAYSNGTYTLTLPKVDAAVTVTVRLYVKPYGPMSYTPTPPAPTPGN